VQLFASEFLVYFSKSEISQLVRNFSVSGKVPGSISLGNSHLEKYWLQYVELKKLQNANTKIFDGWISLKRWSSNFEQQKWVMKIILTLKVSYWCHCVRFSSSSAREEVLPRAWISPLVLLEKIIFFKSDLTSQTLVNIERYAAKFACDVNPVRTKFCLNFAWLW